MAYGLKSYGQYWILDNDVDVATVDVTLYDDSTEDPGFQDDNESDLNENSNISRKNIDIQVFSGGGGTYEFSKSNVDIDTTSVTTDTYVDSYALLDSSSVILTGGLTDYTRINITDVGTVTIAEVGGSFL